MLFDEMLIIAQNVVAQQAGRFGYNDTICVARTVSGRVVIGVSSSVMMNNMPMTIHAEVDLCNNLFNDKDTAVAEMTLLSASSFQPVLPCNDCIGRLVSLNPYNAGTMLNLPDRSVPITQLGSLMQGGPASMPMPGTGAYPGGYPNMGQPAGYGRYSDQQSLSLEQLQGMSPMRNANNMSVSRAASVYTEGRESDDSGLLKNRLNQLLSDDDPDDIEETKEKPKKKFKLFK